MKTVISIIIATALALGTASTAHAARPLPPYGSSSAADTLSACIDSAYEGDESRIKVRVRGCWVDYRLTVRGMKKHMRIVRR